MEFVKYANVLRFYYGYMEDENEETIRKYHKYRTLAKEGTWAVHRTLGRDWGVGRYSRYQYRIYTRKSAQVSYPR